MIVEPRLARPCDDAMVRALLRENRMPGWVEITVEREPSFFAAPEWMGREWAVLGDDDGRPVGMYTAVVRPTHVDGRAEMLGYLGGMRVGVRYRPSIRHVRAGYAALRRLAPCQTTRPWWFTVIGAGNINARRLLEAGVRGLPRYEKCGEYLTSVLPTSRGRRSGFWRAARPEERDAIVAFHNRRASGYQLSPVLDSRLVDGIGVENFLVRESKGVLQAVVALWDQQAFKQVVIRGYRRPVAAFRPAYNLYARLSRRCQLPGTGESLRQTFLAFLALDDDTPGDAAVVADALSHCVTPVAVLGLHAGHRLVAGMKPLKPLRYESNVYTVTFDASVALGPGAVQPEAALL